MNFTFTAPEGRESEVRPLRVYKDDRQIISCWFSASLRERLVFLFYGRVWLFVEANSHPPVNLVVNKTVFKKES